MGLLQLRAGHDEFIALHGLRADGFKELGAVEEPIDNIPGEIGIGGLFDRFVGQEKRLAGNNDAGRAAIADDALRRGFLDGNDERDLALLFERVIDGKSARAGGGQFFDFGSVGGLIRQVQFRN